MKSRSYEHDIYNFFVDLSYIRYRLKEIKIFEKFKFSIDIARSEIFPIELQSTETSLFKLKS